MSRHAFIVEGDMEQIFLKKICGGRRIPVLSVGNGKKFPMTTMATHIGALLSRLNDRHYPVVIVFDRERRKESSDDLSKTLLEELEKLRKLGKHRYDKSKLRIGIPDQMIENWILADHEYMESRFGVKIKLINFEGKHGKNIIRKLLEKESYKETTRGVEMLEEMNFLRAAQRSPSLAKFLDSLDINCPRLNSDIRENP